MPNMERVAAQLRDRIGQITSQYETDIAILRADAQEAIEDLQKQLEEAKGENKDANPEKEKENPKG